MSKDMRDDDDGFKDSTSIKESLENGILTTSPRLGLSCLCSHQDWIIAGSDHSSGTLFVWDSKTESSTPLLSLQGHSGAITCLINLGSTFISGSKDGSIQEWKDLESIQKLEIGSLNLSKNRYPLCFAYSLDKDGSTIRLFSGGTDTEIHEWDLKEGMVLDNSLKSDSGWVTALEISPDGRQLVSGSSDKSIRVWDLKTQTCVGTLKDHSDSITCLSFHQNALISGCRDGVILKWNLEEKQAVKLYAGEPIRSLQVISQKTLSSSLFFMGDDKMIYEMDVVSKVIRKKFKGHFGGIRASAIDGEFLLTASRDGTVRKWRLDLKDPETVLQNLAHRQPHLNLLSDPRSKDLQKELARTRAELTQLKSQLKNHNNDSYVSTKQGNNQRPPSQDSTGEEYRQRAERSIKSLGSVLQVITSQAEKQILISTALLDDFHFLFYSMDSPLYIKPDTVVLTEDDGYPTLQDQRHVLRTPTPDSDASSSGPSTPSSQISSTLGDPIASFEKMAEAFEKSVEKAIDRPWTLVPNWFTKR